MATNVRISNIIASVLALAPAEHALDFKEHWFSWGELAQLSNDLEAAVSELNLQPGARVGVMLRNRPYAVAAVLNIVINERCLVTFNPAYSDEPLVADIKKSPCPVMIASSEDLSRPVVREALEATGAFIINAVEDADGCFSFRAATMGEPSCLVHSTSLEIAVEMMTSGTTGVPKRIPLSRKNFERALLDQGYYEKRSGNSPVKLRSGVAFVTTSLAHIGGVSSLLNSIIGGRRVCLFERLNVDNLMSAIRRHQPKVVRIPPAMLRMLLDAKTPPAELSSLRAVRTGTAPLSPELSDEFTRTFGIPVLQNYGATEFGGGVAGWSLEDYKQFHASKLGAVGRLNPGVEGRIVEPKSGEVLKAGERGALELRAGHIGDGCSWVRTTDLSSLDEDGFLYLHGRLDNVINRGGFKVFADDVREAVETCDFVSEACVVGIADRRLGAVPVCAFTLAPGSALPEEGRLHALLKERLAPYQVPTQFLVVDELPRTPSMKVDQRAVAAMFAVEDV